MSNIILKSNFANIFILHIRGERKLYWSLNTQKWSLKGFKYQDKLNHCNNVYWLRMEHRWHYRNGIIKFYIILIKAINEYLEQIFNTLMETWKCLWHMFLFFLSQSHLVTKFGLLNCVIMDLFLYIQVANTLFLTLHILKDLRAFEIILWNLKCDNYVNGQELS